MEFLEKRLTRHRVGSKIAVTKMTSLRALSDNLAKKYRFAINVSQDFITLINREYHYEIVNDTYCRTLNRKKEDVLGKHVAEIWGKEAFRRIIKGYLDRCFSGQTVHYNEKFKIGSATKYLHVSYYPYKDNNRITHVLVFSRDITDQKSIESKLMNYEYRDHLTGLFNRRSLDIILEKEIEKAKRSQTEKLRGLLFISLERFAQINQTFGHHIGDILLENTGQRIKSTLRKSDYVFRFEGKELTVLLANIARNTDVAKVAQKIINSVAIPYRFKGSDIQITCRVGISLFPDDGEDKNTLIQNATSALNEAKKTEKDFILYNRELHKKSVAKLHLESDIYKAFGENQFTLYYQPVVDQRGTIVGLEALIRWIHPERGLVSPADFIPLAEETGMIVSIGKWTLYAAAKQAFEWSKDHDIYVSINLSAREFGDNNLINLVDGVLKSVGGLDPHRFKLEITETQGMANPDFTIEQMNRLQARGIELCIDDFGVGRSSLSYLKRLPARLLKIDKSFVDDIAHESTEREYLKSIIQMVRSRGKIVLLEGVATREQYELLKTMECDLMQGFLFSRPVPPDEAGSLLRRGSFDLSFSGD
jgi:polar amino acid transport system substrate-binding protein